MRDAANHGGVHGARPGSARAARVLHRDGTLFTPVDLVEMATIGGARALDMDDRIGSLEPGKLADLIIVDTDAAHMQPLHDPYAAVAFQAYPGDIHTTIVNGRVVARDGAVRIDWIGPPVQDIGAYHVYRGEAEAGPYKWVGGVTAELPPAIPVVLSAPYAPTVVDCGDVPLVALDALGSGSLVDTGLEPKKVYWYKVAGVDQSGNETPLAQVTPVSTFTYASALDAAPSIGGVTSSAAPAGLRVDWTPAYDPAQHAGFAVFRAKAAPGPYHQLGGLVQDASFVDSTVLAGSNYWYRVMALDLQGRPSELSPALAGALNP